jgi:hypothetical protein
MSGLVLAAEDRSDKEPYLSDPPFDEGWKKVWSILERLLMLHFFQENAFNFCSPFREEREP